MIHLKTLDNVSTDGSSKSLLNFSPRESTGVNTNTFSYQNSNSNINYSKCDTDNNIIMQDICDSIDSNNFRSVLITKEADCDFYNNNVNNFNYGLIDCEREIKQDEAFYGASSFIWNFEDYFTI